MKHIRLFESFGDIHSICGDFCETCSFIVETLDGDIDLIMC